MPAAAPLQIPRVSTDLTVISDAKSVASFFSETCAPRATEAGPRVGGGKWDGLCGACAGDCSAKDPYYDYAGSLRCLMEDAGEAEEGRGRGRGCGQRML